jgi:putative SOS response-associated peptidase YedK
MCGRFVIAQPRFERIEHILGTEFPPVALRYNIAPTQMVPVIRQTETGTYQMDDFRRGLIPFWSKESKIAYSTFNARVETVAAKPVFRTPFKSRRCLIPASGWFEWKTQSGKKHPYYFTSFGDEGLALADLWDHWRGADGTTIHSCTILVGDANELVSNVHDRMPIILPESAYQAWLDPKEDLRHIKELLVPYDSNRLHYWPVTPAVNQARNDYPELITAQSL